MKREAYEDIMRYEDRHWWFAARRKLLRRILDRFTNNHTTQKVLEVGCGSGGNLNMLSNYGTLYAMEYDNLARAAASRRNICPVKAGSLPYDIPYQEKFDLICALDVVEHIDEDEESVHSMEQLLNPGGILLLTVPAYQFLWSGHDVANEHKRRYTKSNLTALFKNTELNIVYVSYFNTFLFPGVCIARLIDNLRGKENEFDVKMPSRYVNSLFTRIFSAERLFIPKISFPFGVSLTLVAQKTN